MGWYSARIVFESEIDGPPDPKQLREHSIRVLLADTDDAALKKAKELGMASEHSHRNSEGEQITWRFRYVAEVQELFEERLEEGVEVFSRMVWASEDDW